jgi:hypothetical protein
MVIHTEITSQTYAMGSSDPFAAVFEIRIGSLNFQAMGNDYLMRIINCDEVHPWWSTGPGPMPAMPTTDALATTYEVVVSTSTPRHCRRSGQCSRQAAPAAVRGDMPTDAVTLPAGEHAAAGPQFPYGMRNTTATYASSVSTDVAAYEDLSGHHMLAVRNLIATTNDESYHGSTSDLRPAASHGCTEWDFSGVPDPVMFLRFLDTADYWFGCSDDSSIESYDPARECFVVVIDEHGDGANGAGARDGDAPQNPGLSAPPTSSARGADITVQLAQARELEAKLTEEYQQVWLLRATIVGEASARGERTRELGRRARECINTDFNVDDPHTVPRASQKLIAAAMLLQPCGNPRRLRNATCTARRMPSSSRWPCSMPRARRPAYSISPVGGTTMTHRTRRRPSTQAAPRDGQQTREGHRSGSGSLTRANKPKMATPATS